VLLREYVPSPLLTHFEGSTRRHTRCSATLNVARPDMNNYATLGVMPYKGIGGSKDFALWGLARRAALGFVLY